MRRCVSYLRTSTGRQTLGIEAQRSTVADFTSRQAWAVAGELVEQESGKRNDRPQLARALSLCRATGAVLVIARLDRLARNAAFLMSILDSGVDVVFCDLPHVPAGPTGRFILQQMASVAELEAGLISERTKAALAATKARGTTLGGFRGVAPSQADREAAAAALKAKASTKAADLLPLIHAAQEAGNTSHRAIAKHLNAQGVPSPRGGRWTNKTVARVVHRLAA